MGKQLYCLEGMNRAQKQARRNVTRKKAEAKKKRFTAIEAQQKAADRAKERKAINKAAKKSGKKGAKKGVKKATGAHPPREYAVRLQAFSTGGIARAGQRAYVPAVARLRAGKFVTVRLRTDKQEIKWVNGSFEYLHAPTKRRRQKKKKIVRRNKKK